MTAMDQLFREIASATTVQCLVIAERGGLLTAIPAVEGQSAATIAAEAGVDPSLGKALLAVLDYAGIVRCNGGLFSYREGFEEVLGDPSSTSYLGTALQLSAGLMSASRDVTQALVSREGVAPGAYHDDFYVAMENMSGGWIYTQLLSEWIASIEGMTEKLTSGGRVAEIGSGGGNAIVHLLDHFPATSGTGIDLSAGNVERAKQSARWAELESRVEFVAGDAVDELDGPYDLIMALSVLHDVHDLENVLAAALEHLNESGTLLVVESVLDEDSSGADPNMNRVLLATSAMYCIPVSLYNGAQDPYGTVGLTEDILSKAWQAVGGASCTVLPTTMPNLRSYALRKA